jgi:glycosyltransferase involved in cell wall biosynthesis
VLVSIYMPTRNRLAVLPRALDSALAQTYRDIEVIVVDDASEDATQAYLRERSAGEARLRVLRNDQRRGAAATRNVAIRAATGVFATGLDDDDRFEPGRVEEFVSGWRTRQADRPAFLFAQMVWLHDGGRVAVTRRKPSVGFEDMFPANEIGNQIFAPTSRFLEAGLFDERLPAWQDLEFSMRLLAKHGRAWLVDRPSYIFDSTTRPDRISHDQAAIRAAFEAVAGRHAAGDSRRMAQLFLQIFSKDYRNVPTVADWVRYIAWRGQPRGLAELARSSLAEAWRRTLGR